MKLRNFERVLEGCNFQVHKWDGPAERFFPPTSPERLTRWNGVRNSNPSTVLCNFRKKIRLLYWFSFTGFPRRNGWKKGVWKSTMAPMAPGLLIHKLSSCFQDINIWFQLIFVAIASRSCLEGSRIMLKWSFCIWDFIYDSLTNQGICRCGHGRNSPLLYPLIN